MEPLECSDLEPPVYFGDATDSVYWPYPSSVQTNGNFNSDSTISSEGFSQCGEPWQDCVSVSPAISEPSSLYGAPSSHTSYNEHDGGDPVRATSYHFSSLYDFYLSSLYKNCHQEVRLLV